MSDDYYEEDISESEEERRKRMMKLFAEKVFEDSPEVCEELAKMRKSKADFSIREIMENQRKGLEKQLGIK